MNYKKSLLSLVTIMALNTSVTADSSATYLPLSSTTTDSVWTLFGVNGFSNGVPTAATVAAGEFTSGYTSLTDTVATDDLATSGLTDTGNNGDLASVQALSGTTPTLTNLAVAVDITTAPAPVYDETEQVRTMYISAGETNDAPNIKFDYKASLEGMPIEILVNSTDVYNATISQTATWDNPAVAASGNVGATTDAANPDLTAITDVLDFDFSDNPVSPSLWDKDSHMTTTGQTATFYYFNAVTQQWEVWNKNSTVNDFSSFELGKAYWGRVDVSDATDGAGLTRDADGAVGLVLGDDSSTTGIPDENRYVDGNTSRLTAGWNMLAYDDVQPYIRHAATGVVLGNVVNSDEVFVITDASGINSITLTAFAAGGDETDCITANKEIESAKLRGVLPKTFNVKFFRGSADGTIIVLSDEKFGINETTGTAAITATTLTGADLYLDGSLTTITDLSTQVGAATLTTAASSVYGEYTAIAKVNVEEAVDGGLTGANHTSADSIGTATGGLATFTYQESGVDADLLNISAAGTTTLANFTGTQLVATANATVTPTGVQIDADYDGTNVGDYVIIASTKPFTLQDNTYTRVFDYTTDTANATTLYADVSGGVTNIAIAANDALAAAAGKIDNGTSAVASLYAAASTDSKLVVVYPTTSTFDIKDAESATIDLLDASSSSDVVSEGAISDVWGVDTVTRKALNQVTDTIVSLTTAANDAGADTIGEFSNDTADTFTVTVNGVADAAQALSTVSATTIDTYGELKDLFDAIVTRANTVIKANNQHAYASHDYTIPSGVATTDTLAVGTAYSGTITVTGVDVTDTFAVAFTDGGGVAGDVGSSTGAAATGDNKLDFGNGDIVADLKTNPAYSPNYAIYGPLFTLRNAGFDTKAILRATTELDNTTGTIAWDSIDITRNENEWFANNEFNVFHINTNSGYWAYLETKTDDTVAIVSASVTSPGYTYYFSNDDTTTPKYQTTNILSSAQITVEVTNLDDAVAGSVYASIDGERVQLTRSGTTDTFTGSMSNYALATLAQKQSGPVSISVRAVNGKGEAVEDTALLSYDYQAPENMTATISGAQNIALSADLNATKFYAFENYIPELQTTRDALTTTVEINATDSAAAFNACAEYSFDSVTTLRIVAADGNINSANLSNGAVVDYASLLQSANVLSDTGGDDTKTSLGTTYTANCDANVTQTAAEENAGVSIKTLTDGATYRISFQPIDGENFTTDQAWTSHYELTASGGAVIEIQNTPAYAGKTFYVEDTTNKLIYVTTFPADEATADATTSGTADAPVDLDATPFTGDNTTLIP